jgi:DNA-directed RNA polymerase specialized sigma24 family protein
MKQLDRRSQFILESYYLVGMPAADLAQRLGIQPASIHMAIKRCRMQLGKLLSK